MNKKKKRNIRIKRRIIHHRLSILSICGVIAILAVVLSVGSISKYKKNNDLKAQEMELTKDIEEEKERKEEIDEFGKYAGTDQYYEDVAKDKLGLVHENEILFEAEP